MIISFFKDHIGFIVTYIINFILIAVFYGMITNHSVEVIYPFVISIFVLFIFLSIRLYKYISFNSKLKKIKKGQIGRLECYLEEEKNAMQVIDKIDKDYIDEISRMKSKELEKNKFIS